MAAATDADMAILNAVIISKENIDFVPSYERMRTDKFRMTNPSDKSVTFKIKTTRLKQLSTKPAYGILKPKRGIYVTIRFDKLSKVVNLGVDHITVLLAIVPEGKEEDKPSSLWKTEPAAVRRYVMKVQYDPNFEGSPPKSPPSAPPPTPATPTGAPKKVEEEEEEEEDSQ